MGSLRRLPCFASAFEDTLRRLAFRNGDENHSVTVVCARLPARLKSKGGSHRFLHGFASTVGKCLHSHPGETESVWMVWHSPAHAHVTEGSKLEANCSVAYSGYATNVNAIKRPNAKRRVDN